MRLIEEIGMARVMFALDRLTQPTLPLIEFASGATEARRQFQEFAVGAIHDWIDEHESEVTYEPRREPDL